MATREAEGPSGGWRKAGFLLMMSQSRLGRKGRTKESQVVLLDPWSELLGVWIQAAPHLQEEEESGTGGGPP